MIQFGPRHLVNIRSRNPLQLFHQGQEHQKPHAGSTSCLVRGVICLSVIMPMFSSKLGIVLCLGIYRLVPKSAWETWGATDHRSRPISSKPVSWSVSGLPTLPKTDTQCSQPKLVRRDPPPGRFANGLLRLSLRRLRRQILARRLPALLHPLLLLCVALLHLLGLLLVALFDLLPSCFIGILLG